MILGYIALSYIFNKNWRALLCEDLNKKKIALYLVFDNCLYLNPSCEKNSKFSIITICAHLGYWYFLTVKDLLVNAQE